MITSDRDEETDRRLRKFQSSLVSSLLRRTLEIRRDKSLPQSYLYLKNEIIWEFGAEAWSRNKERIVKLLRSETLRDKESRIRRNKLVLRYAQRLVSKLQYKTGRRGVDHDYVVQRVQQKYGMETYERNRDRVLQMLRDKSALFRVRRFSTEMDDRTPRLDEDEDTLITETPACREAREIARKLLERGVLSREEYSSMWFVRHEHDDEEKEEEEEEEKRDSFPTRTAPITSIKSSSRSEHKSKISVPTQLSTESSYDDEEENVDTERDLLHTARKFRLNREIEQRAPEPYVEIDQHGAPINACVIVDDTSILSAADDCTLKLWSTLRAHQPRCLLTLNKHRDAVNGCCTNRKHLAASASDDETVRIWDLRNGKSLRCLRGHGDSVRDVEFFHGSSSDEERLVSVSFDRSVRIWDVKKGQCILSSTYHSAEVNACDTYGASLVMTASDDKTSVLVDVRTGMKFVKMFEDHTHWVTSCALSRDGTVALSCSTDGTARLYDLRTFKVIQTFRDHGDGVLSCAFSLDRRVIVTACSDGAIRVYHIETGELLRT